MASRKSSRKSKMSRSTSTTAPVSGVPSPAQKAPSHMAAAAASAATTAKAASAQASAAEADAGASEAVVDETPIVKRKEFLERVSQSSGLRKNQIKPAFDAILRELGEALAAGEKLNLPPLGKLSVNRIREAENATIVVTKLRRSKTMLAKSDAPSTSESDISGSAE